MKDLNSEREPMYKKINRITRAIFFFGALFVAGCLIAMLYYSHLAKNMKTNVYVIATATGENSILDSLFISINDTSIVRLPVQLGNASANLKLTIPANDQENCFSLININREKLAEDCIKTTAENRQMQVLIYVDNAKDSIDYRVFCTQMN